jgi:hypothetical protein
MLGPTIKNLWPHLKAFCNMCNAHLRIEGDYNVYTYTVSITEETCQKSLCYQLCVLTDVFQFLEWNSNNCG